MVVSLPTPSTLIIPTPSTLIILRLPAGLLDYCATTTTLKKKIQKNSKISLSSFCVIVVFVVKKIGLLFILLYL